jgi:hypothetical protein
MISLVLSLFAFQITSLKLHAFDPKIHMIMKSDSYNPATLEYYESPLAKIMANIYIDAYDVPDQPAYVFKMYNVIRAAIFVNATNSSQALRMVYDPVLKLQLAFPEFRRQIFEKNGNITLDEMPSSEAFEFLNIHKEFDY